MESGSRGLLQTELQAVPQRQGEKFDGFLSGDQNSAVTRPLRKRMQRLASRVEHVAERV